jgi:hypothetical protein
MPSVRHIIGTSQSALADAGVEHRAPAGASVRIVCAYEPERDGTPAVGFYVEAHMPGGWMLVSDEIAADRTEAVKQIERLQTLALRLDGPCLSVWIREFGANL